jgi:hypothetical protein
MPWTPRQKRYLLSSGSPLTGAQKESMKAELHADPSMGHMKKGTPHVDRGHVQVRNSGKHAEKLRHG